MPWPAEPPNKEPPEVREAVLRELMERQHSIKTIAQRYLLHWTTVRRWLRASGLQREPISAGRPQQRTTKRARRKLR